MPQSDDAGGPPMLDFEARRALLQSNRCGAMEIAASGLLFDLIRDAAAESMPFPTDSAVQPTIYDRAVAETAISLDCAPKATVARNASSFESIYLHRLEHATHLPHRGALFGAAQPLSEIIYACGFRDDAHFARRFGYSPGAYAG